MAKWLCIAIAFLFLLPFNGLNESIEKEIKMPLAIASCKINGNVVIFNASHSTAEQYRWDFDNDGIYDTSWLPYPVIKHVYSKPYNGFAKLLVKNEYGMDEKLIRVITVTQEEDQKQEKVEDFVKIYGINKYAQTFIPTLLNLTEIKIYVARKGISLSIFKILERISFLKNLFLGDLYVYLYKGSPDRPEQLITYVKLSPDEVSKEGSWISIDFGGIIIADDLNDWGSYLSIVLEQDGGNEWNYYKWYYAYNDPYPNGTFYYYEGGKWKEDKTRDFAFITYGKPTGDEPDGIEERWAVFVGGPDCPQCPIDLEIMKKVLVDRGWDPDKIWTINCEYEPKDKFWEALEQMKENEDMDDICIVGLDMHSGFISYSHLDRELDEGRGFACKGMLIIVESCGSGIAIRYLAQPKRVIITSCKADEKTGAQIIRGKNYGGWLYYYLADQTGVCGRHDGFPPPDPIVGAKDGAFARTDPDTSSDYGGNNDGWISAEEAYEFAYKWVVKLTENLPWGAHPQFYDGYLGDLNIVKWRD